LKFGSIEICFGAKPQPIQTLAFQAPMDNGVLQSPFNITSTASQDSGQPSAFDRDLLDELRTSQLMIDDPHGFEHEQVISQLRSGISETIQNR
jgi:hypothetical protein